MARPLVNQTVAAFRYANGIKPVSECVATINSGDGLTSTGSILFSGSGYRVKVLLTHTSAVLTP